MTFLSTDFWNGPLGPGNRIIWVWSPIFRNRLDFAAVLKVTTDSLLYSIRKTILWTIRLVISGCWPYFAFIRAPYPFDLSRRFLLFSIKNKKRTETVPLKYTDYIVSQTDLGSQERFSVLWKVFWWPFPVTMELYTKIEYRLMMRPEL